MLMLRIAFVSLLAQSTYAQYVSQLPNGDTLYRFDRGTGPERNYDYRDYWVDLAVEPGGAANVKMEPSEATDLLVPASARRFCWSRNQNSDVAGWAYDYDPYESLTLHRAQLTEPGETPIFITRTVKNYPKVFLEIECSTRKLDQVFDSPKMLVFRIEGLNDLRRIKSRTASRLLRTQSPTEPYRNFVRNFNPVSSYVMNESGQYEKRMVYSQHAGKEVLESSLLFCQSRGFEDVTYYETAKNKAARVPSDGEAFWPESDRDYVPRYGETVAAFPSGQVVSDLALPTSQVIKTGSGFKERYSYPDQVDEVLTVVVCVKDFDFNNRSLMRRR